MKKLMIVIPALNEEESLGTVIKKIPLERLKGFIVEVLVIDDGSTDKTLEVARQAGATHIISHPTNMGLGASIREGLTFAYNQGADIGVMIDADDEYPAEEIPELIAPILGGEADYVLGSRFKGKINGMKLHRRLGNYFFTLIQSVLLGRFIHDGQSGFRAFSRPVLRDFEIIHDYNYAQVLTLNIVRKGYRMMEVPINYKVRSTGKSFITFKGYMTNVLPAIWKEMSRRVTPADREGYENSSHRLVDRGKYVHYNR